jgi:hypothetical protein
MFIELGTLALRPAAVRDEPLITPVPKQHPTQTNNPDTTINPPVDDPSNDGDRGDILLRGLWKNQYETIIDIRVTATDANAFKHQNPHDVLRKQEKEKKKKSTSMIEPSSKSTSTPLPNHKIALSRVTYYTTPEQPIETDPNIIIRK